MTLKHDFEMLVLISAKYRLLQNYSNVVLCITAITHAMFFYFAVLNIHAASKILETITCTSKLL